MAQFLKEEVGQRISAAARRIFADRGHAAATMAEIAAVAHVSTGNVYRYFETKEVLFAQAVPQAVARQLSALVTRRVEALHGVDDVRSLSAEAPWHVVTEELLAFCIENRLAVVVLLGKGKADGTQYQTYSDKMVHQMVKLAIGYATSIHSSVVMTPATRFALESIYCNFLDSMTAILEQHDNEASIREAIDHFSKYHLAGMKAFFEGRSHGE